MNHFVFVILMVLCVGVLPAEIEQVAISWTPTICQPSCVPLLKRTLEKVHGVATVEINQPIGQAIITWKPNIQFAYEGVDSAMRMVGITIWNIRLRVTGKLERGNKHYYLVSNGDHTRFDLLAPVTPVLSGQANQYNSNARALTPYLQQKLMEGAQAGQIITIDGPLFMPWRHNIPVELVIDQMTFTEPNTKESHGTP